jgi:hypothetical protein
MTSVGQLHQPTRTLSAAHGWGPSGGAGRRARVRVSADAVVSAYVHEIAGQAVPTGAAHAARRHRMAAPGPRRRPT